MVFSLLAGIPVEESDGQESTSKAAASTLGHKQTFALQVSHVGFAPESGIQRQRFSFFTVIPA